MAARVQSSRRVPGVDSRKLRRHWLASMTGVGTRCRMTRLSGKPASEEPVLVIIGIDAHKASHTLVGVDAVGRKVGSKVVPATTAGHLQAIRWAHRRFGAELRWAVEDCRGVTRRLEDDLTMAGYSVTRVPAKLVARTRSSAGTSGKSDPIDALAVGQAAVRDPRLPIAMRDDAARELKLLVDRREDLIEQRTATNNRLLWRLHELDPEYRLAAGDLTHNNHRLATKELLDRHHGLVADLARDELADITRLCADAQRLQRRIATHVRPRARNLLAIPGCGDLSAAKIVAETAGVQRFATEAAFARFAGVAPEPAWSGATEGRMRYVKGGNRRINAALHRIAVTQLRDGTGSQYYRKRLAAGDSPLAALRCMKRRIARRVYSSMKADAGQPTTKASSVIAEEPGG